jgi:hypothetical protein
MNGITFFTAPKPFVGHIGVIQNNAIKSWSLLPNSEIILCGKDDGIEEAAKRFNAKWIPEIETSQFGTPLLNAIFRQSIEQANNPLVCYINADIMLSDDFLRAAERIHRQRFLMVGRRWNVDITEPWNFHDSDWQEKVREHATKNGELFTPAGIDYFLFPRGDEIGKLRPFIVGRPRWDNWFIFNTRRSGCPVIDATNAVVAVHQNHDYRHVPQQRGNGVEGPEADWNERLVETPNYTFTIDDATHMMGKRFILPAISLHYLKKRLKSLPLLHPGIKPVGRPLRKIANSLGFQA